MGKLLLMVIFCCSAFADSNASKSNNGSVKVLEEWKSGCAKNQSIDCYNLGVHFARDKFDEKTAIDFYIKACEASYGLGCFNLGGLLIKNPKARLEGLKAFSKACEISKDKKIDNETKFYLEPACKMARIIGDNLEMEYNQLLMTMGLVHEYQISPTNSKFDKIEISSKEETFIFSKLCSARRTWPEISGLSDKSIEEKLNSRFKKILTVGKKLKKSDCADESNEVYQYKNSYGVGGKKGDLLGIYFQIIFPGGSTRIVEECRIFNLKTGKEIVGKDFLKSGASEKINEKFKKIELESFDMTYGSVCLGKSGFVIQTSPDGKTGQTIPLTEEESTAIINL